jgi:hypothetical protein
VTIGRRRRAEEGNGGKERRKWGIFRCSRLFLGE